MSVPTSPLPKRAIARVYSVSYYSLRPCRPGFTCSPFWYSANPPFGRDSTSPVAIASTYFYYPLTYSIIAASDGTRGEPSRSTAMRQRSMPRPPWLTLHSTNLPYLLRSAQ